MKLVRVLQNTIHNLTGAVRRGDVVELPDDLADHWTGQHLAEDADGAEPTHGVPHVQDDDSGEWVPLVDPTEASEEDAPDAPRIAAVERPHETADHEAPGATVAEPTSGPMTGENGAEAPAAPTVTEPAAPATDTALDPPPAGATA